MLLNNFIDESEYRLTAIYPQREAHSIIMILCEERIGVKNYTHIVDPMFEIPAESVPGLHEDVDRLAAGEPLQYVLGYSDFCDRRFTVNNSVLIPRPETEIMTREAVKIGGRMQRMRVAYGKDARPVEILDLCTGSGCIAWTLALSIPGSHVVGVDISADALEVASGQKFEDALADGTYKAPEFIWGDILEVNCEFGQYDILVANPPYIRESEKASMRKNVLDFEPALALFVSDKDPLVFYRAIAQIALRDLISGGRGFVEINEELGGRTRDLFVAAGFREVAVIKDLYAKDRFISFVR